MESSGLYAYAVAVAKEERRRHMHDSRRATLNREYAYVAIQAFLRAARERETRPDVKAALWDLEDSRPPLPEEDRDIRLTGNGGGGGG
jgi:hypothetical protein